MNSYINIIAAIVLICSCSVVVSASDWTTPTVTDLFVPDHCDNIAQPTDHLLLEYNVILENGTIASSNAVGQLFHLQLDSGVSVFVKKI
jgi:hypothetical protein